MNTLKAGASFDALETSQLLISSDQLSLALVKSGLKGIKATMQALHSCLPCSETHIQRLPDRKRQHPQLNYRDCQTLIFNKITAV